MEKATNADDVLNVRGQGRARTWLGAMLPNERRALMASWAGWVLDGMDMQMYSFTMPTLIATWSLTRPQAGAIGTVMLIASALGGWVAGYLSDRIGRVKTLQLTVVWFATFSLLSGLVQNYEQLLTARALMGLGFGGEFAAGAVLLSESVRQSMRGKALGINSTGFAIGWGLAAVLFEAVFALFTPAVAWRVLFILGALPALLVIYVRRYVEEPEVFRSSLAGRSTKAPGPFVIFQPALLRRTLICAALSTGGQGAYYAIANWLPTFLSRERGLNVASTGAYVLVTVAGGFFGYLAAAYLSDRIGRRGAIVFFGLASIFMLFLYTQVSASNPVLLTLGFPLGFFSLGAYSVVPTFFTETFPTYCRGLSLGFVHNFGRATGSFVPLLVGLLSERVGLGVSFGVLAAGGYAMMVGCTLALPETRGQPWEE